MVVRPHRTIERQGRERTRVHPVVPRESFVTGERHPHRADHGVGKKQGSERRRREPRSEGRLTPVYFCLSFSFAIAVLASSCTFLFASLSRGSIFEMTEGSAISASVRQASRLMFSSGLDRSGRICGTVEAASRPRSALSPSTTASLFVDLRSGVMSASTFASTFALIAPRTRAALRCTFSRGSLSIEMIFARAVSDSGYSFSRP